MIKNLLECIFEKKKYIYIYIYKNSINGYVEKKFISIKSFFVKFLTNFIGYIAIKSTS